jgi:hypothetical protein
MNCGRAARQEGSEVRCWWGVGDWNRRTGDTSARMKVMPSRLTNGLLLLMALVVLGASSQAAVCEVACATLAQSCCPGGADGSGPMATAECSGSISSMAGMSAHFRGESSCIHGLLLAVERNVSVGTRLNDVQWSVVEVLPVGVVVHGSEGIFRQRPRLRRHWIDPLVVSLRV